MMSSSLPSLMKVNILEVNSIIWHRFLFFFFTPVIRFSIWRTSAHAPAVRFQTNGQGPDPIGPGYVYVLRCSLCTCRLVQFYTVYQEEVCSLDSRFIWNQTECAKNIRKSVKL